MQLNFFHGYPDYVGKRFIFAGYGTGPTSYVQTGDPIYMPRYDNYIDLVFSGVSVSGTYTVRAIASALGPRATWSLLWYVAGGIASGSSVIGATVTAPGTYTGTTPTITFAAAPAGGVTATGVGVLDGSGTALIGILITNPGSGYLTAPAITVGAGGATATAILSPAGASSVSEVAAGTNLSGETVQIGGYGGVY